MSLNFLVAPDFAPQHFSGWHMLNTLLQRRTDIRMHLLLPDSAAEQAELLASGRIDLVYANPFDAAELVRKSGFIPLARPAGRSDEMVIAACADSSYFKIEDLRQGCSIAVTENRDIRLIGLRLLEPADLTEHDIRWTQVDSYQAAARLLVRGHVDAAFFMSDAYHSLSRVTRERTRVLVESALKDIAHIVLAHPRLESRIATIQGALLQLGHDDPSQEVLEAVGLPHGFEPVTQEDAEFMIDLMDTLLE